MSGAVVQYRPVNYWRTLLMLFGIALVLRLMVFGYIAHEPRKFYTYDSDGYDRRAQNILRYGEFASEATPPRTPDLDRTPIYPLYLAAVWALFGHQPALAIFGQLVLGALTAVLSYLLARGLRLPHLVGVAAGLFVALEPVSVLNANRLLTETICTMLVVAGATLLVHYWNTLALRWVVASALVFALAALTRPISQFLPVVLVPFFVVVARKAGWRRALISAALFLVLSLGVTYSWAVRNYARTGVFTLSTISDTNLIYYRARAVLADVEHTSQEEAWNKLEAQINTTVATQHLSPAETVALQRQMALDIFRRYPLQTGAMLGKGIVRIFADPGYTIVCSLLDRNSTAFDCFPGRSTMNEPGMVGRVVARLGAMTVVQVTTLLLSVIVLGGLYLGAALGLKQMVQERRWLVLAMLLLLIGYFVGLAAGAEANSRFRVPVLPFVAILSGIGVTVLREWVAAHTRHKTAAVSVNAVANDHL